MPKLALLVLDLVQILLPALTPPVRRATRGRPKGVPAVLTDAEGRIAGTGGKRNRHNLTAFGSKGELSYGRGTLEISLETIREFEVWRWVKPRILVPDFPVLLRGDGKVRGFE